MVAYRATLISSGLVGPEYMGLLMRLLQYPCRIYPRYNPHSIDTARPGPGIMLILNFSDDPVCRPFVVANARALINLSAQVDLGLTVVEHYRIGAFASTQERFHTARWCV